MDGETMNAHLRVSMPYPENGEFDQWLHAWCMALTAMACEHYVLLLMLILTNALMPLGFWRLYQQMKRIERVVSGRKSGGIS